MRVISSLWVVVSLLAAVPKLAGEARVGALGNPDRIEIRGARTFAAGVVHRALVQDFNFQMAAHPSAPRDEFVGRVQKLVEAGFQRSGFSHPVVKVSVSRD